MWLPIHHVTKIVPRDKSAVAMPTGFHPAPNQMLHLYVYPHLANEMPVFGYETEFGAYEKERWVANV